MHPFLNKQTTLGGLLMLLLLITTNQTVSSQIMPNGTVGPPPQAATGSLAAYPAGTKVNYIRTWTPSMPTTDPEAVKSASRTTSQVKQTTQYFDGLGRLIQTVDKAITPGGRDRVTPIVYDAFGREAYKYLPYPQPTANTDDGKFKLNPFENQKTAIENLNLYPGEDIYYGKTHYEASPLNRVLKTMAPGNSWTGSNRGVTQTYESNTSADGVRIWTIGYAIGSLPQSSATYDAGTLYKYVTTDADGNKTATFKDKLGHIILKKTALSASATDGHTGWLSTYYVYDDLGNLRFVIPPKAVNYLRSHNWTLSQTVADRLCFRYEYDGRKRMIVKKVPGADEVEMVYDNRDRLVFEQDGNERTTGEWKVTYYDELNREIKTGLYSGTDTRSSLQDQMDNITDENPEPPVPSSKVDILTYTYYDDYSWSGSLTFQSSYLSKTTDGDNPYAESPSTYSSKTKGLTTGTKVRILDSHPEKWLITTTYYDDKGRELQVLSDNISGGTDVVTNKYDFSGKLLSCYTTIQNNNSTLNSETKVLTENHYDAADRLLTITKTIDDDPATERTITTNTYDELGQLKTKVLGNNLETLSYTYNIRGWLTGINPEYAEGTGTHFFGMELNYDYGFTQNQYNGNIAGEIWRSSGDGKRRAYGFSYDDANRLTQADFTQHTSGDWDVSAGINYTVSNLDYDANGNILSMKQEGLINHSSGTVDNLSYHYQSNSNQLDHVNDDGGTSAKLGDFKDGHTGSGDYSYDANGNLKKDLNKGISSISYNYLNKPEIVDFGSKGTIQFVYDATGNKLQKIVTDNTASPSRTVVTNYVNGFIYQASSPSGGGQVGADTLQYFPTEEGRVRYLPPSGGTQEGYVYDYFVKDHLGNTRVVLTEQTDFSHYIATMEPDKEAKEEALFYNLNNTRTSKPADYPQDNTTTPNQAVAKLNGKDPDKRIGPSIILKVMAGDTIQAAVRAYYKQQAAPKKKVGIPAEQMLAGLVQALVTPGMQAVATHSNGLVPNARMRGSGLTANDLQQLKNKDPKNKKTNKPKAYLNYVFFDKQLNFVDEGSGIKQVDGEAGELETLSSGKVVAKENGYVYVFTSNESNDDVFFDNFGVMDITGPVLEETHYYPFGLTMSAISTTAPLKIEAKRKFNGIEFNHKEFSDGSGLDLYTAKFRGLDPQIGRWWQVDPKPNTSLSPYAAMDLNPILNADPLGDTTIINGSKNLKNRFLKLLNSESTTKFSINKQGKLGFMGKPNFKTIRGKKSGILAQNIVNAIKSKKKTYFNLVDNKSKVLFDSYKSAKFDVADYERVSKYKDFTAAIIGHVFAERLSGKSYNPSNNSMQHFISYHNTAKNIEASILYDMRGEFYAPLYRNESSTNAHILFFKFNMIGFDYGDAKYDVITTPDMKYVLGALKIK